MQSPFTLICFVLFLSPRCLLMAEELPTYAEPVKLTTLENRSINESSGLAASRRHAGRLWTHNDSGDKPRLFCFDHKGKHLGTSKIRNAKAVDWEDMCSFELDGRPWLLIGDFGDNAKRRKSCSLYLVPEPEDPKSESTVAASFKLTYSTGSMDCEAVGVDPVGRKLLFVEKKRWVTCRVFEADLPTPRKSDGKIELVAQPIALISVPLATAMDISPDGLRAIVLTLGQAFEFSRGPKETWKQAFSRKPRTVDMPPRKQGEAICYDRNGLDLFLTSELTPTPLFQVPVADPVESERHHDE